MHVCAYLKQMRSFVNIFCSSYGVIMLLIFQNLIYYRDRDWMLDAGILDLKMLWICVKIKVILDLRGIIRLWSPWSKFDAILEMVSDSEIHLFKLDDMLECFTIETKDFKSKTVNVQSSQSEVMLDLILQ